MEPTRDTQALAIEYIEDVGRKQFDRVAELLHPDVEFHTTGRTLNGSADYIAALQRLGLILERNEVRTVIADGNVVCIVYDFVTDTAAGAVKSAEWITFDAGRIRSARLVFDHSHWPTVLAELGRRATIAA